MYRRCTGTTAEAVRRCGRALARSRRLAGGAVAAFASWNRKRPIGLPLAAAKARRRRVAAVLALSGAVTVTSLAAQASGGAWPARGGTGAAGVQDAVRELTAAMAQHAPAAAPRTATMGIRG